MSGRFAYGDRVTWWTDAGGAVTIYQLDSSSRVTAVPVDRALLVDTWWDLGMNDETFVWFVQRNGYEIRLVDCYKNSGEGLPHYAAVLDEWRREHGAVFSGDVLFQGSVGRVDLPGGDWPTLLASIESLINAYPAETTVYPGHMGITSLGQERDTNPFLRELAHQS